MNKTVLVVSLVIGIAIVAASYLFYLSGERDRQLREKEIADNKQQETQEATSQVLEEITNEQKLNECLDLAFKNYKDRWDSTAKKLGYSNGLLPQQTAESYNKDYKDEKDECYRRYQ